VESSLQGIIDFVKFRIFVEKKQFVGSNGNMIQREKPAASDRAGLREAKAWRNSFFQANLLHVPNTKM